MSLGMAAYRLYWYRTASSLAPMATLEEVGADYEAVEVDCAAGAHREPAYRQIHPLGLLPALLLPDGRTVFESGGQLGARREDGGARLLQPVAFIPR